MKQLRRIPPGRIRCCVPFCGRSFKRLCEGEKTICGKHWRLADKSLRRRRTKLLRWYSKHYGDTPPWKLDKPRPLKAWQVWRMCSQLWERALRQAIERSQGI